MKRKFIARSLPKVTHQSLRDKRFTWPNGSGSNTTPVSDTESSRP
ncbi:hypothetical protein AB0F91_10180 [Amycolatopsis sp. NPDC023774]